MKTQTFETNTEKQVPIQLKKNGSVICDTDNTVLEKQALKSAAGLPCRVQTRRQTVWVHAGITIMLLVKEKSFLFKTRLFEAGAKVFTELLEIYFVLRQGSFSKKLHLSCASHSKATFIQACGVYV